MMRSVQGPGNFGERPVYYDGTVRGEHGKHVVTILSPDLCRVFFVCSIYSPHVPPI